MKFRVRVVSPFEESKDHKVEVYQKAEEIKTDECIQQDIKNLDMLTLTPDWIKLEESIDDDGN